LPRPPAVEDWPAPGASSSSSSSSSKDSRASSTTARAMFSRKTEAIALNEKK